MTLDFLTLPDDERRLYIEQAAAQRNLYIETKVVIFNVR